MKWALGNYLEDVGRTGLSPRHQVLTAYSVLAVSCPSTSMINLNLLHRFQLQ
jgi:hypothetical protein